MTLLPAALVLLAPALFAEPQAGYVVKVDSASIYLDFTEKTGAAPGREFQVYTEGEELKHPVTGQSLGRIENTVGSGKITDVLAMYSVGRLSPGAGEIKPGMRARLGAAPAPEAPAAPAAAPAAAGERAPRWKSPSFGYKIAGMAVAAFDGKLATVLADEKTLYLYDYPPAEAKAKSQYELPGNGTRVLSLEAADVKGDGKPQLFVTTYDQNFNRVETSVFEIQDGKWNELERIPWMVRATQDPAGNAVMAAQQLVDDATFPFSSIYPLVYKDGKFGAGKPSIKPKRVDWIYDFTRATFDDAPATLYLTSLGHVRVQFDKGSWKTRDAYCQTPVRLRWPDHNGRLLEFHPPMRVAYGADHKAAVYLPRNLSMLGSLSEPFGLFNGGELQRLSWDGVSLVMDWKSQLGGYAPTIDVVDGANGRDVAVPIVGTSGRSMVWIYDP